MKILQWILNQSTQHFFNDNVFENAILTMVSKLLSVVSLRNWMDPLTKDIKYFILTLSIDNAYIVHRLCSFIANLKHQGPFTYMLNFNPSMGQ